MGSGPANYFSWGAKLLIIFNKLRCKSSASSFLIGLFNWKGTPTCGVNFRLKSLVCAVVYLVFYKSRKLSEVTMEDDRERGKAVEDGIEGSRYCMAKDDVRWGAVSRGARWGGCGGRKGGGRTEGEDAGKRTEGLSSPQSGVQDSWQLSTFYYPPPPHFKTFNSLSLSYPLPLNILPSVSPARLLPSFMIVCWPPGSSSSSRNYYHPPAPLSTTSLTIGDSPHYPHYRHYIITAWNGKIENLMPLLTSKKL